MCYIVCTYIALRECTVCMQIKMGVLYPLNMLLCDNIDTIFYISNCAVDICYSIWYVSLYVAWIEYNEENAIGSFAINLSNSIS